MLVHRWLEKLFDSLDAGSTRRRGRQDRRRAPPRRLAFDSFEDRLVPASFTVHDVSLIEGNAGTTNALVTVTLSEPSNRPVSVAYRTANASALAGSDYQAVSGRLNFTKGQTSKTILVPIMGDTAAEPDETFFVNLSSPKKATIADGQAVVTIDDGDPTIGISNMTITEGNAGTSIGTFKVTLSAEAAQTVTVDFATADGSALAGSDYDAVSGSVTFNPGQTSMDVSVVVKGDRLAEPDQTFVVNLSNASGAALADSQAVGTIVNDEPVVSVTGVSQAEGDSGTTNFAFNLTLSAASSDPILVEYNTADMGATAGSDYEGGSGTLTIPANEINYTMNVLVYGDEETEVPESFVVNLSSGAQAWATIENDDGVLINITDSYVWEEDYNSTFIGFTVTLSAESTDTVTVDFTTYDGWASEGWDYVPFSGTVTFAPGETSQTFWVEVVGDYDYEGDEYFSVNLSNNTGGNSLIQTAWANGWIYDNDYYYDPGWYDPGYYW